MTGAAPSRRARPLLLAGGIVALEFAAAVTSFVASTLLPVVAADLGARDRLALLIAGSTLGLFVALPLAGRTLRALGTARTLGVGVAVYLAGVAVAATAAHAGIFGLGQFAGGLASGVLAVFGVSTAIRHLDESLRIKVVAASSAMWILPAMVGPAATLGMEHLIGWRWTLLIPVPFVLIGRILVLRTTRGEEPPAAESRPLGRTLLAPIGVTGIVLGAGWWPVAAAGTLVAAIGISAIMPRGTGTLARGTPAALASMTLFAVGYFGADSLVTVLLTDTYKATLGQAALVLSAAPLAWALTSLTVPRFVRGKAKYRFPVIGLTIAAAGVAATAIGAPSVTVALIGWTITGIGVGLAYPALCILSTTPGAGDFDASELAAAVITAEAFGGLLGRAAGGAFSSGTTDLTLTYLAFATALVLAVYAATRASTGQ